MRVGELHLEHTNCSSRRAVFLFFFLKIRLENVILRYLYSLFSHPREETFLIKAGQGDTKA